jgi:hypothetical protein
VPQGERRGALDAESRARGGCEGGIETFTEGVRTSLDSGSHPPAYGYGRGGEGGGTAGLPTLVAAPAHTCEAPNLAPSARNGRLAYVLSCGYARRWRRLGSILVSVMERGGNEGEGGREPPSVIPPRQSLTRWRVIQGGPAIVSRGSSRDSICKAWVRRPERVCPYRKLRSQGGSHRKGPGPLDRSRRERR